MLIKNRQIADPATIEAINTLASAKVPARAAFVLAQNLKLIADLAQTYEKARSDLVVKYAHRNEAGELVRPVDSTGKVMEDSMKVAPDKLTDYYRELQDLLEVETELNIKKVKLSDVGNVELSVGQMSQLLWLIDEV